MSESTIREQLLRLPTSALSDAQGGTTTMQPGIACRVPGVKLVGVAHTVFALTGSVLSLHRAVLESQPGDVLVVNGQGDGSGAVLGELMARDAQHNGMAGAVIDGAVRDVAGLQALGFPVFSRWLTPRVGTNRRLGTVGGPVVCGGVLVHPGDWIVGDDDGVCVIPREQVAQVIEAAQAIEDKERKIAAGIDAGQRVADLLGIREALLGS
jgi:4-hydroxy-4-methyl-2-oxoglutarate aldolase